MNKSLARSEIFCCCSNINIFNSILEIQTGLFPYKSWLKGTDDNGVIAAPPYYALSKPNE